MPRLIQRLSESIETNAAAVLAAAGVLSFWLYQRFLVQPANLLLLAQKKQLTLFSIVKGDFSASVGLFTVFLALMLLYGISWWAARRATGRSAWLLVLGWSAAFGASLLFIYPYGAIDIFDYIIRGRMMAFYGLNPMTALPTQIPNDPLLPYAFWKNVPSAYGPLWELLAALTSRLAGSSVIANVLAYKLLVGAFWYGGVALVALILRRHAPERALAGVLLLAWNPMGLFEILGNGHNDALILFFILLAAWALASQHHTTAILALVLGALSKFIPVLLLPAAGLIALRAQPTLRAKIRFVLLTGVLAAAVTALTFAPVWAGPRTLSVLGRVEMYAYSLPTLIYLWLSAFIGNQAASVGVGKAAAGLTISFALYQGWRAWQERSWLSFPRAAFATLTFYLLVSCTWFMVWYTLWPLALAVLLPPGAALGISITFCMAIATKLYLLLPLTYWQGPPPEPRAWRDFLMMLGTMGLTWLYGLQHLIRRKLLRPPS